MARHPYIAIEGVIGVGKTTLAKRLLPKLIDGVNYFNWDLTEHRKLLSTQIFSGKLDLGGTDQKVIVFDEIHKYRRWKNAIKGLFDKYEPNARWIITGSAALNVYRKGQDSLMGRAFTYNLCPLSVAELQNERCEKNIGIENLKNISFKKNDVKTQKLFDNLTVFSGFPEPYLKNSLPFLRKWRSSRLGRLINQDLASIENLKNLSLVEQLMFLLPERVGSPLSLNSLREDLEVHFATVKHWMKLLERIFYGFSIQPYSGRLSRMIKKEIKWYLWDWTEIDDDGYRFENLIAVHLLKYVHYINDLGLDNISLHYVRDKEKREVDFLLCRNRKPHILVECKMNESNPSKSLLHFSKLFKTKRAIQVMTSPVDPFTVKHKEAKIDVVSAASLLQELI